MANSISTRLEKVRAAIDTILDGGAVQQYEINGRQLSHYSLTQLMELEKRLISQLNAERTNENNTNYIRYRDAK